MSSSAMISHSQMTSQRRSNKRRLLKIALLSTAILIFITMVLVRISAATPSTLSTPVLKEKALTQSNTKTTDAGGTSTPVKPAPAAVSAPSIPNCAPALSSPKPVAPKISASTPGVVQTPTIVNSYTVYGNSTNQIMNQLNSCTPVSHDGSRYAASAEYAINWSFQYQSNELGLCTISNATVGLNVVKTMPKWQQIGTPNQALQSKWDKYLRNLNKHEDGHAAIDRQYAEKILASFENYPPTSCETINEAANARANSIIKELNAANEAYDSATNHGANEGATL